MQDIVEAILDGRQPEGDQRVAWGFSRGLWEGAPTSQLAGLMGATPGWHYIAPGKPMQDGFVERGTLWGGSCLLFDNGPRLRVDDDPAIENADRITIEAWVNTLSWPTRAVVCRKDGSYILYNYSGGGSPSARDHRV